MRRRRPSGPTTSTCRATGRRAGSVTRSASAADQKTDLPRGKPERLEALQRRKIPGDAVIPGARGPRHLSLERFRWLLAGLAGPASPGELYAESSGDDFS